MNELKKMKDLFDDFIKEADKFVSKQKIKQTITTEKTIYWGETADKEMKWEDAKAWCEEKGGRLPTLKELKKAYEDKVKGFSTGLYWSSTPYFSLDAHYVKFSDCFPGSYLTYFAFSVRCVYDK